MHHRQRRIERIKANQEPFLAPNSAINFKSFQSPRDGHSAIKKKTATGRPMNRPSANRNALGRGPKRNPPTWLRFSFVSVLFVGFIAAAAAAAAVASFVDRLERRHSISIHVPRQVFKSQYRSHWVL